MWQKGLVRPRLDKKALENRTKKMYYSSCYSSVPDTFKDTHLSLYNDPAGKNYDSHSTGRFRPKFVPFSCDSNIGSSVS